ncbi:MAG: hypothetical protein ACRYF5_06055, partial [Janthinobacterium lividum]
PANGYRLPANGYRLPATGKRLPATGYRLTANGKRQTANGKRQTANGKRQLRSGVDNTTVAVCLARRFALRNLKIVPVDAEGWSVATRLHGCSFVFVVAVSGGSLNEAFRFR